MKSDQVKFYEIFGGFLAFRNGKALRTKHGHKRIFKTEAGATIALKRSVAGLTYKGKRL